MDGDQSASNEQVRPMEEEEEEDSDDVSIMVMHPQEHVH